MGTVDRRGTQFVLGVYASRQLAVDALLAQEGDHVMLRDVEPDALIYDSLDSEMDYYTINREEVITSLGE